MPIPTRSSERNRSRASSGVMRIGLVRPAAPGMLGGLGAFRGSGEFDRACRGNQASLGATRKIILERVEIFSVERIIDALTQVALERVGWQFELQRGTFGDVIEVRGSVVARSQEIGDHLGRDPVAPASPHRQNAW